MLYSDASFFLKNPKAWNVELSFGKLSLSFFAGEGHYDPSYLDELELNCVGWV